LKLVIGIVRPEKANDVLEALYRAEVRGVSMSRVQGHGGELDRVETYRGTTVKMGLSEKVRFEVAVSDAFVEPTIAAVRAGAQTGEVSSPLRALTACENADKGFGTNNGMSYCNQKADALLWFDERGAWATSSSS